MTKCNFRLVKARGMIFVSEDDRYFSQPQITISLFGFQTEFYILVSYCKLK